MGGARASAVHTLAADLGTLQRLPKLIPEGVAREIATKPPVAVWATKQAITYARDHPVADGLRQMGWLQSGLWDNEAVAEAIRARAEKRAPRFPDLEPLRSFAESDEESDAS